MTNKEIEDAADNFLRSHGSADLILKDEYITEVANANFAYGKNLRHPPNGRVYEPIGDSRVSKTKSRPCPKCGEPLSKYSKDNPNAICRKCFSKKAMDAHKERLRKKYKKIDEFNHKYSATELESNYAFEKHSEGVFKLAKFSYDFTITLIEEIFQKEISYGLPLCFIPIEAKRNRKKLFFQTSSADRMFLK